MNTRPPRVVLTIVMIVSLLVCVVFLLHHAGLGLYPDRMESWLDGNSWLMWTAAALTVGSALAIPPLALLNRHPDDDR
ncbi:hypothetical protein [Amycolatopsis samaneae]|uniref:DUF3180 domain-containing protein n=1 Tax=Amycolatopsis samaneae TaxID=664691 RepID=A0ABW5GFE0_9PSEU